ncbi:hypothetical protein OEZ85_001227 [Tetradesmus obliquus]|uniref:Pesticidal crystal protein Cry22Aa Ig-like domain-containing protein n=1 Tax=Tetradesmus obliquus TaxID=3088 RepID=A0ABY8UMR7_TETOB|nr:hypothetical protein OEZ85_001227 [Tetradesmus obliquus]
MAAMNWRRAAGAAAVLCIAMLCLAVKAEAATAFCTANPTHAVCSSGDVDALMALKAAVVAKDTAGNQATPVKRYVTITPRCAAPERWCADLSSCSFKGVCSKALAAAMGGAASPAASAARYVPPADKTPPQLKLLGNGTAAVTPAGAIILMESVAWRSSWEDAGAAATDAMDGNVTSRVQAFGAGAVDTSLPTPPDKAFSYVVEYSVADFSGNAAPTARRLIKGRCVAAPRRPESTCLSSGCSPAVLRRHYFAAKGLAGCGINTAAAVGTRFTVDFWVWGSPILNATVSRTVVVSDPCPSRNTPYFCTDSNKKSFCSGSPCDQAAKMLPPPKPAPQWLLHPAAAATALGHRYASHVG